MPTTTAQPDGDFSTAGWQELWRKEDWWAIWIGLSVVLAGCVVMVGPTLTVTTAALLVTVPCEFATCTV